MSDKGLLGSRSRSEFHESDYHTPRKRKVLDRNFSAFVCLVISLIVVILVLIITTIALRLNGNHDTIGFYVTLGDTQLISIDSYFCDGVKAETSSGQTAMFLLEEEPPLDGSVDTTILANFRIDIFKEYIDDYGWYDYDYYYGEEIINYVTWSFQLYRGSTVSLRACIDNNAAASFLFIQGKENYKSFKYNSIGQEEWAIPSCREPLLEDFTISENDRYYFIFQAEANQEPMVNLMLQLNRTEYSLMNLAITPPNCTATTNESCNLMIPLAKYNYVLLKTADVNSINYGTTIQLNWYCLPRQWIYIVIFFIPIIFCTMLFTTMYCLFCLFNRRKLASYEVLYSTQASKLVYNKPI